MSLQTFPSRALPDAMDTHKRSDRPQQRALRSLPPLPPAGDAARAQLSSSSPPCASSVLCPDRAARRRMHATQTTAPPTPTRPHRLPSCATAPDRTFPPGHGRSRQEAPGRATRRALPLLALSWLLAQAPHPQSTHTQKQKPKTHTPYKQHQCVLHAGSKDTGRLQLLRLLAAGMQCPIKMLRPFCSGPSHGYHPCAGSVGAFAGRWAWTLVDSWTASRNIIPVPSSPTYPI